jgi:hypothetical protein
MAKETNGDFIRNANQLSGDLKQLIERTDLVYVLAFQPRGLSKPGAFHELKVKVRVPASKISARSGYYEPKPYRNLTPMERVLASGDLLSGGGGSQLPVSMLAAPYASTGKVAQVPVILEIPGKSLLEGDTSSVSGVLVYAYASDSRGVHRLPDSGDHARFEARPREARNRRDQVLRDSLPSSRAVHAPHARA